ncbi:phage virion morphogenesis protein [Shewanella surugensis]|uniref:Phage virion morphogenesis protein n=1 Tax=Shewanella surugensis TaxID=212020 RepID=A0ABT0L8M4_9GAMM|nr:phage virion morphogenesis protein [Shewanella surugensis]MCL1123531.1 phage virion morphogenesis protein [Shewanella surugensis]
MSLQISLRGKDALTLKQQLELLSLPRNKRIRLLKHLGRIEKAKARKRIQAQKDVKGAKFKARKKKGGKMLKAQAKGLTPYVKNANRLELTHKNKHTAKIGAVHQEGGKETMSATRMRRIHGANKSHAACTRSQAKALVILGYKVKAKNKGYRKATIKELVSRLSQSQAGGILHSLRGKQRKTQWNIDAPKREFLGDSPANVRDEIIQFLHEQS